MTGNPRLGVTCNIHFSRTDKWSAAMGLAADAGFSTVRIAVGWDNVEPTQGARDFTPFRQLVDVALAAGLTPEIVLQFSPRWISSEPTGSSDPEVFNRWPPNRHDPGLAAWSDYAAAAAAVFKDATDWFEVWNEPDLKGFWAGTRQEYVDLLQVGHQAIKSQHPNAQVVYGGLSLGGTPGALDEQFFESTLALGAAPFFDVANYHSFGDLATATNRFNRVKLALAGAGVADRPIWVTEFGYSALPINQTVPGFLGGEPGQAAYLHDMASHLLLLPADRVFCVEINDVLQGEFTGFGLTALLELGGVLDVRKRQAYHEVQAFNAAFLAVGSA